MPQMSFEKGLSTGHNDRGHKCPRAGTRKRPGRSLAPTQFALDAHPIANTAPKDDCSCSIWETAFPLPQSGELLWVYQELKQNQPGAEHRRSDNSRDGKRRSLRLAPATK